MKDEDVKIGQRVILSRDSRRSSESWYHQSKGNAGIVVAVDCRPGQSVIWHEVKWDHESMANFVYPAISLILCPETQEETVTRVSEFLEGIDLRSLAGLSQ